MRITKPIVTHSGYAVLFDSGAVRLQGQEPDLELLQRGAAEGTILAWPALDDETTIMVLVDEPAPPRLASAAVESSMELRVPSGVLWLTDPAYLHESESAPIP